VPVTKEEVDCAHGDGRITPTCTSVKGNTRPRIHYMDVLLVMLGWLPMILEVMHAIIV
jgi:hypothetical protein